LQVLALGGGGELALAAHHRVMFDDSKAAFGLPESLVGLFTGSRRTQRLPRLIGIENALPVCSKVRGCQGKLLSKPA